MVVFNSKRRLSFLMGGLIVVCIGIVFWFRQSPDPGEIELRPFVFGKPPVPVVFTSRSSSASLQAAAPSGEVFTFPGQPLWQASQGRLRLLTPNGTVHELTWGKKLPNGSTLIDVISPSVSPDGRKIIFAGRQADDHGHFRLYEININGTDLRQLTGGPHDSGCVAVPPMRFAKDKKGLISDKKRCQVDYDDVDPIYLNDGRIVFTSTRIPDLGRDQARRSSQLWIMNADGWDKYPLTANRNNDRWPCIHSTDFLSFTSWSRNQEVVSLDGKGIVPYQPGLGSWTRPTNHWNILGLHGVLTFVIKENFPVWRAKPLFNGRLVAMTAGVKPGKELGIVAPGHPSTPFPGNLLWPNLYSLFQEKEPEDYSAEMRIIQMEGNRIATAPSATAWGVELPKQQSSKIWVGPVKDQKGQSLRLATPSPCPPKNIVAAGAVQNHGKNHENYGIYLMGEDWGIGDGQPVSAEQIGLQLLFDDPGFVDAEPVAVYPRMVGGLPASPPSPYQKPPASIILADGSAYEGPMGFVGNTDLITTLNSRTHGGKTDTGAGPLFSGPPEGLIQEIHIYSAERDRFDHPSIPRIPGQWKLLMKVPVEDGTHFQTWLPVDSPTVLVGVDKNGVTASWTSEAKDSSGHRATFFAFAGDHYSGLRAGQVQNCIGCHPGHSGLFGQPHPESIAK